MNITPILQSRLLSDLRIAGKVHLRKKFIPLKNYNCMNRTMSLCIVLCYVPYNMGEDDGYAKGRR